MLGGLHHIWGTLFLHRTELLAHVVNRWAGLLAKKEQRLLSVWCWEGGGSLCFHQSWLTLRSCSTLEIVCKFLPHSHTNVKLKMACLIADSSMETQAKEKGVRAGPEAHRAVTYSTLGDTTKRAPFTRHGLLTSLGTVLLNLKFMRKSFLEGASLNFLQNTKIPIFLPASNSQARKFEFLSVQGKTFRKWGTKFNDCGH